MSNGYPIALNRNAEDRAYHVRCRDLPELLTAGAAKATAFENAADALVVAITGRIEDEDLDPGRIEAAQG
jgi:predicted RNase H-like HicB family nuclease